jgi:hypothetical protein
LADRAAAEGAIWVERPDLVDDPLLLEWSRAGTQPARWDVFDPDGRYAGTVEMSTNSTSTRSARIESL